MHDDDALLWSVLDRNGERKLSRLERTSKWCTNKSNIQYS